MVNKLGADGENSDIDNNSLKLHQENIKYFYGEINKIFQKYSSSYLLEDLFETFKIDLDGGIVNFGVNKNPKEIITVFGLNKNIHEKLESLFLFLEIEKQIELVLGGDIKINQGLSDLISLYNSNSEIKIEDNDDIKNQIKKIQDKKDEEDEEKDEKIEKSNKFLESILKKIEENEKKQKKLEVYKNGLDKIKEEYNSDLFFSYFSGASFKNDKIGLSKNEKKVFSQLYSSAISGVKDIESNITRFYSEENPEYKKSLEEEQKKINKVLWEEKKQKIGIRVKKGVFTALFLTGVYGGIQFLSGEKEKKDNNFNYSSSSVNTYENNSFKNINNSFKNINNETLFIYDEKFEEDINILLSNLINKPGVLVALRQLKFDILRGVGNLISNYEESSLENLKVRANVDYKEIIVNVINIKNNYSQDFRIPTNEKIKEQYNFELLGTQGVDFLDKKDLQESIEHYVSYQLNNSSTLADFNQNIGKVSDLYKYYTDYNGEVETNFDYFRKLIVFSFFNQEKQKKTHVVPVSLTNELYQKQLSLK